MAKFKKKSVVENAPKKSLTRKELRKEQRILKKQKKCTFFEKMKQRNNVTLQLSAGDDSTSRFKIKSSNMVTDFGLKKTTLKSFKKVTFSDSVTPQKETKDEKTKHIPKKKNLKENLMNQMKSQRKRQLLSAVKQDEKEIKVLEKRLKLNKRKNKSCSRGFVECGLDYILDVCDPDRVQSAVKSEVNLEDSDSDFFEDVAFVEGKKCIKRTSEKTLDSSNDSKVQNEGEESDSDLSESISSQTNEMLSEDESNENQSCEDKHLFLKNETDEQHFHEDIYGRLRDSKGNIIELKQDKYVPPHLRISENTEINKAKKQLKGLLNRLAQSNMYSIANEIESLYSKNSRNAINEIIIELFFDNLITHILTPERLIIDHSMLIGILHANVGMEVGAYILQRFIEQFDCMFSQRNDVENKKLDNVLYLISYLYNFKIFEAYLMYDILNKLCINCTEKNVDLILVVLKSVGFVLRKDNPSAMKNFLLTVQKKFNQLAIKENSRMKYMLSVLVNIKNNNISKLSEFDPSQHEQHKKVLKNLIRKGNNIVTLRIGLNDLLNVKERGKWWLVGSAWKNDDEQRTVQDNEKKEKYSAQLLEIAKKQRMNTDNRRNMFCVLMTADDYLDAFEKILRLGLKGQQEREIPLVLMHCLLHEKNYNPFYGLVADQLCMSNRSHQMTLQCALWDRFRDLSSLNSFQIHLLAKFLAQLLIAGALPISVLKVVEFAELDKKHIRLLRQTILSVANESNVDSIKEVFIKVAAVKKLSLFREALKLFIHHFILRNMAEGVLQEKLHMISTLLTDVS